VETPAVRAGPLWLMAAIAVVAIVAVSVRADLAGVIGIPAAVAVVVAAWYLRRPRAMATTSSPT
jgi:hypothetical protein